MGGINLELLEWLEGRTAERVRLKDRKYFTHVYVGIVCVLTLLSGILYAALSKTVYFWDDATYWDIGRMLSQKPLNLSFFSEVYRSIGASDYNYLGAVPIALWLKVFGVTRVSYIACIITLYLIPAEIVLYRLTKNLSKAPLFTFTACVLIMPSVLYLACIGFMDVGGVLVGLACYYLYYKETTVAKQRINHSVLGVLLTVIMVFRRYFAFFSVAFLTAMAIDCILFKKSKANFAITVAAAGVVLIACFHTFLFNILLQDYGTLYSGYKYSVMTDLKLITRYFGVVFLAVTLVGVPILSARKRNTAFVFPLIQIMVCVLMFVSTQTHGQQHLLLYVPSLAMLVIAGVNVIDKQYMLVGLCVITAMNFVSPMINRVQPQNIQEIHGLAVAPSYSVKPKVRDDAGEILRVKQSLDTIIPEGKTCGVAASSFTVNSSILTNVEASLNRRAERDDEYIVGLPEVDSRDYWRLGEIYESDYLLVGVPPQTHLADGEQTIITELVNSFVNGTDIAGAFEQVREFKGRIDGVELKLYKRVSEVSETAKTEYKSRLNIK